MNNWLTRTVLALAVIAGLIGSAPAATRGTDADTGADTGAEVRVADISANQAAQIAMSQFGGTVLRQSQQGNVYRIKLKTSNGVIYVCVDANSGRASRC